MAVEVPSFTGDIAWMNNAACKGMEGVFDDLPGDDITEAKKICATCPVIEECLDWAVRNRIVGGIWGGLEEDKRRSIARQRARQRRQRRNARATV